jgi:hypothetical protein
MTELLRDARSNTKENENYFQIQGMVPSLAPPEERAQRKMRPTRTLGVRRDATPRRGGDAGLSHGAGAAILSCATPTLYRLERTTAHIRAS